MLDPRCFAEYVGFTEDEVRTLCEKKRGIFRASKNGTMVTPWDYSTLYITPIL